VRHPTDPYVGTLSNVGSPSDTDIHVLVSNYLERLARAFPELRFLVAEEAAKDSKNETQALTCLPVHIGDEVAPWDKSFFFQREDGRETERTLVVLAANDSLCTNNSTTLGIRVVVHLPGSGGGSANITSMSAYLREGVAVKLNPAKKKVTGPVQSSLGQIVRNNLNVDPSSREPASSGPIEGIKSRSPSGRNDTLKKYFDRKLPSNQNVEDSDAEFVRLERSQFARPTLDIDAYNKAAAQRTGLSNVEVSFEEPTTEVEDLRSDHFTAVNAYYNSRLLFERFKRYRIDVSSYFRSARQTLAIHYRSGMPYGPGRDGQTVNAAVQPRRWDRHQIAPIGCQEPPELDLHFALANRSHRGRKEWDRVSPSPAEPLGIAADPRWVWHEFGHVLLMATTGELEMRFAHSLGDALAAIVADPGSSFVDTADNAGRNEEENKRRWRGATFPWVHIPRRHDRCVKRGWSWSGAMHKPLRELPDAKQPRRKGYRSEQILSTSLFRLYLCLGGMTPNPGGLPVRQAASDYTLYLIIKGLGLLGDARIVAANHPDQLVSALIDADVGTESFKIDSNDVPGGFAHKVIRWAFEAQGLYADGAVDNNDRGGPPAVDIYIEDRRSEHEHWCGSSAEHGKGSYVPVSLEGPKKTGTLDQPRWFSNAIKVDGNEISVRVGNRGSEKAKSVNVTVFYTHWDGDDLPPWEAGGGNRWIEAGPKGGLTKAQINKRSDIGPFSWKPDGKNYLILAVASCADDRANTDPASCLPCSRKPMPLADLVANDNNLGLTLWSAPK
jgi:hypothetical protein